MGLRGTVGNGVSRVMALMPDWSCFEISLRVKKINGNFHKYRRWINKPASVSTDSRYLYKHKVVQFSLHSKKKKILLRCLHG